MELLVNVVRLGLEIGRTKGSAARRALTAHALFARGLCSRGPPALKPNSDIRQCAGDENSDRGALHSYTVKTLRKRRLIAVPTYIGLGPNVYEQRKYAVSEGGLQPHQPSREIADGNRNGQDERVPERPRVIVAYSGAM